MHARRSQSYPIFKESKSVPFRYSLSSEWKRFCRDSRVEKRIRLFPSKRNGRPYSPRPSPAIKPPPGRSPTSGASNSNQNQVRRNRRNPQPLQLATRHRRSSGFSGKRSMLHCPDRFPRDLYVRNPIRSSVLFFSTGIHWSIVVDGTHVSWFTFCTLKFLGLFLLS
jgi:hypothetical protein